MDKKHKIALFATGFALFFTALTFAWQAYYRLWMTVQVMLLPLIYSTGYQILMHEQEQNFKSELRLIMAEFENVRYKYILLKRKIEKQEELER